MVQTATAVAERRGTEWVGPERRTNPLRAELDIALRTAPQRVSAGRRVFDVVFALLVLVCGAPVFAALVLAVKLTSEGPALYGQRRVGRHGRAFRCWKFRTMVLDADSLLADLLAVDPELREEFSAEFKLRRDPRVTAVGRFLRRTSLDELPQFFNVLRGDMSVVGPRPIVWEEAHHYGPHLAEMLTVRPGLTGIWQVSGRNALTFPERVRLQSESARHQSLRRDLAVVARTVLLMFAWKSNGAF